MQITRRTAVGGLVTGAVAIAAPYVARAQEAKHYRFAYDQPKTTGYGILGDIFANKLKELSNGTMLIDQYPGAQLGQEPQVLQLVKSGDVEFCISSSANAATLSPQAGVMSLHFLFRSEDQLVKAMGEPLLSMTEHQANNSFSWVSDKLWNSLSPDQQKWVQAAADEVNKNQTAKAIALEHESADKLKSIGVKIVTDVDKTGFHKVADPYLDKMSAELGPHATKVKDIIRAIS